jgi:ribose 5-phosphate isomerase B
MDILIPRRTDRLPTVHARIMIGSDHIGVDLKETLTTAARGAGCQVEDLGTHTRDRVDYPNIARNVASAVIDQSCIGVLICGSGVGMQMAANRYPGIRAVLAESLTTAFYARAHNDANVLCLGARRVTPELALSIFATFMATPFDGRRHQNRVDLLSETGPA